MSADLYRLCPCCSGKKVKFCCSRELAADIERIERMMLGDQLLAGLERLEVLRQKHPQCAALSMLEFQAQLGVRQLDRAEEAIDRLLQQAPQNPGGQASKAFLLLVRAHADDRGDEQTSPQTSQKTTQALQHIQQSLAGIDGHMPALVPRLLGTCVNHLHALQLHIPALALATFLSGMEADSDDDTPSHATVLVLETLGSPDVPLVYKGLNELQSAPAGATWHRQFQVAIGHANRGRWEQALETFRSMSLRILDEPAILWNLATVSCWLGRHKEAIEAWRAVAKLRALPLRDRVEAALLSLTLPQEYPLIDPVAMQRVTFQLTDVERAQERALSSPWLASSRLLEHALDVTPPPRAGFHLLDCPWPQAADPAALSPADVPRVEGQLLLFGRETDQPARAQLLVARTERYDEILQRLRDLFGDALSSEPAAEETIGENSRAHFELTPRIAENPKWTRVQNLLQREEAFLKQLEHTLLDLKLSFLAGETLRDVAAQPHGSVWVHAALLYLQHETFSFTQRFDPANWLQKLQVDPLENVPFELCTTDTGRVAPLFLSYIDVTTLAAGELSDLIGQCQLFGNRIGIRRACQELVRRDDWPVPVGDDENENLISTESAYRLLSDTAVTIPEALAYTIQGRDFAVGHGKSPAHWLITELQFRLTLGEATMADRILQQLMTRHSEEPGVREAVYHLLVQLGVIDPSGAVRRGPTAPEGVAPPATGQPANPSQLWTPDHSGNAPTASAPEGGSKLWVPD